MLSINPEYKSIISKIVKKDNKRFLLSVVKTNTSQQEDSKLVCIESYNKNIQIGDAIIFAKNKYSLLKDNSDCNYFENYDNTINKLEPYFSVNFSEKKDLKEILKELLENTKNENLILEISKFYNLLETKRKTLEKKYFKKFSFLDIFNDIVCQIINNSPKKFYYLIFGKDKTNNSETNNYKIKLKDISLILNEDQTPSDNELKIFKEFFKVVSKKIYLKIFYLLNMNDNDIKYYLFFLESLFNNPMVKNYSKCNCLKENEKKKFKNLNEKIFKFDWCINCMYKKITITDIISLVKKNPFFFLNNSFLADKIFTSTHSYDFPSSIIEKTKMLCLFYKEICKDKNFFLSYKNCFSEDELEILYKMYNIKYIKENMFYLNGRYILEKNICKLLSDKIKSSVEKEDSCSNNEDFIDIKKGVICITGGPGTGKTTLISKIEKKFKGYNILFCAFTGKAICKLRSLLINKENCFTIHYILEKKELYKNIKYDILIIDEASMVSPELFYTFLTKVKFDLLILVGDVDQLPPIEWGNVFSPIINVFKKEYNNNLLTLTKNYRQNETLKNIILSFNNNGTLLIKDEDILFYSDTNGLEEILRNKIDIKNFLCLSPINKICDFVNNIFNKKYSINENLILNENIYYKDEKNDSILIPNGLICKIIKNDKVLIEDCMDKNIELKYGKYSFKFCYCLTIHKMQGSECENMCLILPKESLGFINKSLFYTAISRPKNNLKIITNIKNFNFIVKKHIFTKNNIQDNNNFMKYF